MSQHDIDTELDPRLAAAFNAIRQQPASHPDWSRFEQQIIRSLSQPSPSWISRLTRTLERWLSQPLPRLGLATSALLAMVAGLMFMTGQPGISYASVITQLREMNTMILSSTVEVGPDTRVDTIIHYQRPDLIRTETTTWMGDQSVSSNLTLTDLEQRQSLVLIKEARMAMVIDLPEQSLTDPQLDPLFWLHDLQLLPDEAAIELGTVIIDGFEARGYQQQTDLLDIIIWADVQTSMPVRFEVTARPDSILPADFSILGDAQLDVELDPSLFLQDIPENYQLIPIDARD